MLPAGHRPHSRPAIAPMLALALAACLLASAAHAWNTELCNNNTCYYYQNNTDTEHQIDGALLRQWARTDPRIATNPIAFGPPTITSITLAAGRTFPAGGTPFHLAEDAYYVVINGSATIGSLGDGTPCSSGDWMWSMA